MSVVPFMNPCGWPHSTCKKGAVVHCSFIDRKLCKEHAEAFGCDGDSQRCGRVTFKNKERRR